MQALVLLVEFSSITMCFSIYNIFILLFLQKALEHSYPIHVIFS